MRQCWWRGLQPPAQGFYFLPCQGINGVLQPWGVVLVSVLCLKLQGIQLSFCVLLFLSCLTNNHRLVIGSFVNYVIGLMLTVQSLLPCPDLGLDMCRGMTREHILEVDKSV